MKVYYLCTPGTRPAWELDNPDDTSHVVRVHGGDYHDARGRALHHAADAGATCALVLVGYTQPVQVNRASDHLDVRAPHPYTDHALLLYAGRILRELAGAVYLEHVSSVLAVPRSWAVHRPSAPMVAAYQLNATVLEHAASKDLGLRLCEQGYRTVTLGDFAYDAFGEQVLREQGTQKLWKRTYEKAIETLI